LRTYSRHLRSLAEAVEHILSRLARFASLLFLFFNDPSTTEIYTLSLHDALPISEDAICFSRSVKIPNTCIKGFWIGNARRDRRFTNSLDHRGERFPGEGIDEVGPARIHIHHARGDVNRFQPRLDHKRIELPAKQGVATCQTLQLDLALDCLAGCAAIGMEVGRSVVTLNDSHGATRSEQSVENRKRLRRSRQVLQDETDEDVVEGFGRERQRENVRLLEHHVSEPRRVRGTLGFRE